MKPGGRLAQIVSRVPPGISVTDVGCDHGYASIELARRGCRVTAVDIAEGPLEAARQNAARFGETDRITFIKYDGIPADVSADSQCAVIAGMGGETIIDILRRAEALKRPDVTLVLQPQTKKELLRSYLLREGWSVRSETCFERGRSYEILTCVFKTRL